MLVRFALVLAVLAAPAGAVPLCRDLKGLYTPCPPGHGMPRPPRAAKPGKTDPAAPAASSTIAAGEKSTLAEPGRSLVAHSKKLCRDTRGLYTPCPR
jgi:hypothetical protein